MKFEITLAGKQAMDQTAARIREELLDHFIHGYGYQPGEVAVVVVPTDSIEPKRMFFGGIHVWNLADGYKIVLLETLSEYRAEDRQMELHCSRWHGEHTTDVLSLRDDISTPRVTFKVDHETKSLIWIKGPRGTSDIVLKYRQLIKGWLDDHGFASQNVLKV